MTTTDAKTSTITAVLPSFAKTGGVNATAAATPMAKGASAAGAGLSAAALSKDVSNGAMVVAATTGATGASGSFTATSLQPQGTWSTSGASGDFQWSYPIQDPNPGYGADVAPDVDLSYDSGAVDGQIAGGNTQTGLVGEGWGNPGESYIERTYQTCSDDSSLPTADQTGDECWAGQILTMQLQGQSNPIVIDDSNGTYHLQGDDGSKLVRLTGADNHALAGEYWQLTTTNGVVYTFGENVLPGGSESTATNSVDTEPVYGPTSGDPCYNATFKDASCTQAYRWNLDMVQDPHHVTTIYNYTKESNYYGPDNSTTPTTYDRYSELASVIYGIPATSSSVYANPGSDQITLGYSQRCIASSSFNCASSSFNAANAAQWPDTPQDLVCASTGTCNTHSPSFWTQVRLTSIATAYRSGSSWVPVDSYAVGQDFPSSGDAQMDMTSLTQTGHSGSSTATLPSDQFEYITLANRVTDDSNDNEMQYDRLTDILTETGEHIQAFYNSMPGQSGRSQPLCTTSTLPSDVSENTSECFPVYWTQPYAPTPTLDFFHKYVVTEVTTGSVSGIVPERVVTYTYEGSPAWHYDDNPLVKAKDRTYGQWRGYGKVQSVVGSGSSAQTTVDTYFRGMDGDTLPTGTRSVSITDSTGHSYTDSNQYADTLLESQVYNGTAQVSATITAPTTVATTASQARSGMQPLVATMVRPASTMVLRNLATGGEDEVLDTYGYDAEGRQISDSETGSGLAPACTTTSYADNTTSWIRDDVAEVIHSAQACPAAGTAPSGISSDIRSYYDGSTTLGAVPGAGDETETDTAISSTHFAKVTTAYDSLGRQTSTTQYTSATDTTGRTSSTVYTPSTSGPVTQVVQKDPLGHTSTEVIDPGRYQVTSETDVAGHVTTATYDPLGRLTAVWKPGQTQGSTPATTSYAYQVSQSNPSTVTATTLVDAGTGSTSTTTNVTLYDSYGEVIQTQDSAVGSGAIVNDTAYDDAGRVSGNDNHFYITENPSTTLQVPTTDGDAFIANRTVTSYDGAGRPTTVQLYDGNTLTSTTTTVYGGNATTVIPPTGGVEMTTITNPRGETTETDRWSSPPTFSGNTYSGGTAVRDTYTFNAAGEQTQMVTAAGTPQAATFTTSYDMAGRQTSSADPDSGTTTTSYDDAGDPISITDAQGSTVAQTFDADGRLTGQYQGSTSGTQLTGLVYDTLQTGQQTSATRYVGGKAYTTAATGYDNAGRPTGTSVSLSVPGFAAAYTSPETWTSTGLLKTATIPAAGSAPAETLTYGYNNNGDPVSVTGGNQYVAAADIDHDGKPLGYTLDQGTDTTYLAFLYDAQTLDVTQQQFDAGSTVLDNTTTSYDLAGNITSSTDTQGASGAASTTTCYNYDHLDELTQAWTSTDNCSADPSTAGNATVGGAAPFWESWTYDAGGSRTTQTAHQLPATATPVSGTNPLTPTTGDNVTTSAVGSTGHAHDLTGTTTTGPNAGSTSQTVNADGQVTARTTAGGSQTLTWDPLGFLASVTTPAGTTSYVNDASGDPLLETDPSGATTLYLGSEDVTVTGGAVSNVTRYYDIAGRQIAYRVGTVGPTYVDANTQGTTTTTYTPSGSGGTPAANTTRQYLDPYGNNLAATSASALVAPTLATNRSFLGAASNGDTGLISTGLRKYDPTTGTFMSVDPVRDPSAVDELNGYAYGGGNPVTNSDPTGARYPSSAENGPHSYGCGNSCWSESATARYDYWYDHTYLPELRWEYWQSQAALRRQEAEAAYDRRIAAEESWYKEMHAGWRAPTPAPHKSSGGGFWGFVTHHAGAILMTGAVVGLTVVNVVQGGADPLTDGLEAEAVADDVSLIASEDAGEGAAAEGSSNDMCATQSFIPTTKVILASGATAAISTLRVGEKVVASDPVTGKTTTKTIDAVWINHDTDLMNLAVRTQSGKQTVIHTTAHHPFWDNTTHAWTEVDFLHPGDELRSLNGQPVTVVEHTAVTGAANMWDLTIDNLHDFYIATATNAVLVHNYGCDEWASNFASKNGGEIKSFSDPDGLPLGEYRPDGPDTDAVPETWFHHTVVLRDDLVYDEYNPNGASIDDFKQMFQYHEFIHFGF
ncbi:polymorphic toxin-type HINT domain-containing protein [Rudaeicoccus suwonensis]|uniref:polymorphic toxin-type HINT domain-containing protein n=1 Tax=Rudaeicoccus suwonensis TaxID=657409 RepID=UPI001BAD8935|nr:polymorphic toxin-type HINT domain-containing protein [Rudaeicoccus suwonensis]